MKIGHGFSGIARKDKEVTNHGTDYHP